jgi:hypothetical protein
MRLAEKPDELSYMSTSEIFEHNASNIAYLNLGDLVDAGDGSDTAARAVIDRLSKTRRFAAEEVVCSSRNTRRYLAIFAQRQHQDRFRMQVFRVQANTYSDKEDRPKRDFREYGIVGTELLKTDGHCHGAVQGGLPGQTRR